MEAGSTRLMMKANITWNWINNIFSLLCHTIWKKSFILNRSFFNWSQIGLSIETRMWSGRGDNRKATIRKPLRQFIHLILEVLEQIVEMFNLDYSGVFYSLFYRRLVSLQITSIVKFLALSFLIAGGSPYLQEPLTGYPNYVYCSW